MSTLLGAYLLYKEPTELSCIRLGPIFLSSSLVVAYGFYMLFSLTIDFSIMDYARAVSLNMSTLKRSLTPYMQNESKLIDLVLRIELIRTILSPGLLDFLRNSTIHIRMFLYLVTCFLRVVVSLLRRSQARTISYPLTN